ncbi:hypothetical protein [Mesorhizobium sp. M0500]|uniref:hypothetical protein n=1 Tax=unclassified Mesorhizobium TaxID=325217 RepID=UPI00333DC33E
MNLALQVGDLDDQCANRGSRVAVTEGDDGVDVALQIVILAGYFLGMHQAA